MYLLFDIGGTRMRIALSRDLKKLEKVEIFDTPKAFSEGMVLFKKFKERNPVNIKAVCGGIAGLLSPKNDKLTNSRNLIGWVNKPLKKSLEKVFECKVRLENDADLGGLGEAVFGSGKDKGIVAFITVGSGVGGTRILEKKIDKGVFGFEPGKQIIELGKSLEDLVGGKSFEKKYKKYPKEIKNKRVWEKAARWLAIGLFNSYLHWSPEIIVIGGSMVLGRPAIPIKVINQEYRNLGKNRKKPMIRKAKLSNLSGLYGACALLENK